MDTSTPRRGIERKIISSILWVGILPLAIALVAGYVSVRHWQSQTAQRMLATQVEKVATGWRIATRGHIDSVERLSTAPVVLETLRGEEIDPAELAETVKAAEPPVSEIGLSIAALYDREGEQIASSSPFPDGVEAILPTDPQWPDVVELNAPFIVMILDQFRGQVVVPIHETNGEPLGYAVKIFDIRRLVEFALGLDPILDVPPPRDVFILAYASHDGFREILLEPDPGDQGYIITDRPAESAVEELLRHTDDDGESAQRVATFPFGEEFSDAFVAFEPLFEDSPMYLMAARSVTDVFLYLNQAALAAVLFCAGIILILCLSAYRNVHNNIVRNLLLVNEGAQIIGQGDLELKLRIDTGDEIEELANSFNNMAAALKHNMRSLEESERKYRNLVNSMRDGIIQTDLEGRIGLLNPSGGEILGVASVDDLIGRHLRELFAEDAETVKALTDDLREQGFVERTRIWVTRHDGHRICLEISGNVMRNESGAITGIEGIFRDVTDSVVLEKEVGERAERISAINQIANVINSSLHAGRLYESLVREVQQIVPFDFASLSVLNERGDLFEMRTLWPERDESTTHSCSRVDEAWCAPRVLRMETSLIIEDVAAEPGQRLDDFPDDIRSCLCVPLYANERIIGTLNLGSRNPSDFSAHEIDVMNEMAPHVAAAIRNAQLLDSLQASLDEVTRAREELHAANEELKTLDELKTNLLSNVSHELRTPLVAVMGYTDMIYNGKVGPVNEVQRNYLSISLRNIEKLVTLIENLLDFSRLHRGAETLVFDTFDLVECARSSLEIVRPVAESREIELILSVPDESVLVEGDKGKLGQVFNNLLSNAVKFTHQGGSVTVEIVPSESSVEARVTDTGIGIPPEAIDRVFTRFYQYDGSSTRKYGGTGIGLSIAQDIVRLHGGRITVESEVGRGSTFRFSLPLRLARKGGERPAARLPVAETHLLVELITLDRSLSTQVRTYIDSEEMDVMVATDANHAMILAAKHRPDCLIVDYDEGRVSDDILDVVIERPEVRNCPIILLTQDESFFESRGGGVASRLKPGFRKSSLLSAIHYAVGHESESEEKLGNKILIVDDDPEIVQFMVRCLVAEGYVVDHCSSGEEALQMVTQREYGLVLLDIAMPGIDGWETCRRIKQNADLAGIKVHMVTAKSVDGMDDKIHESGADGVLLKPFRPEELLEMVSEVETVHGEKETT